MLAISILPSIAETAFLSKLAAWGYIEFGLRKELDVSRVVLQLLCADLCAQKLGVRACFGFERHNVSNGSCDSLYLHNSVTEMPWSSPKQSQTKSVHLLLYLFCCRQPSCSFSTSSTSSESQKFLLQINSRKTIRRRATCGQQRNVCQARQCAFDDA